MVSLKASKCSQSPNKLDQVDVLFSSFFVFFFWLFFFLHGLPDHRCVHKCVHILLMNLFKLHHLMCVWMCVRAFLLWVVHCMFVHFSSRIQGKAHHKLLSS